MLRVPSSTVMRAELKLRLETEIRLALFLGLRINVSLYPLYQWPGVIPSWLVLFILALFIRIDIGMLNQVNRSLLFLSFRVLGSLYRTYPIENPK